MLRTRLISFLAGIASLIAATSIAHAQDAAGSWITEGGKSVVRISPCGGSMCGKIVSLKEPKDANGKPKLDSKNENTGQRNRPILGLSVLQSMKKDRENRWAGSIYNPEDGKTYKAYMTLNSARELLVEGCVLGGLICKKQRWKRQ